MPHCVLEYTENNINKEKFYDFFKDLHNLLINTKEFKLEAIKSRAIPLDCYVMGNGDLNNEFYYLNISILSGRSENFRKKLSESILNLMKKYFKKNNSTNAFSLAVNIHQLEKETYAKHYEES